MGKPNRKIGANLLIQEHPMVFSPTLAKIIGLNEAIVLQQIQYWESNPNNKGFVYDGYKWVYNTMEEWKSKNFTFLSVSTLKRTFSKLAERGLLLSMQMNKGSWNHTKCYRIDHERLEEVVVDWDKLTLVDGEELAPYEESAD
jgi:hypothetical protein